MNKEVNIYFKVEGLDGYITNLGDLQTALGGVEKATEDAANATKQLEDTSNKLDALEGGVKTLAGSFEILAGAASLLGIEDNEFLSQLEENVVGVLTLSQGAIDAAEGIKLLAQNQKIATVAQRIFNTVANANPYVLLATTIIALTGAIAAYAIAMQDAENAELDYAEAANEAAQGRLDIISETEESLKRQGLTEEDITDEKIAQLQTVVETSKIRVRELTAEKKADVERRNSYKLALSAILQFISSPIAMILGAIDEISVVATKLGFLDEALTLRTDFFQGVAGLIFNPEKVAEEADAEIAIIEEQGRKAQNTIDGFLNRRRERRAQTAQKEADDEAEAQEALRRARLTEQQRELDDIELHYADLITKAGDNAELVKQLEDQRNKELEAKRKAHHDANLSAEEAAAMEMERLLNEAYLLTLDDRDRQETLLMQAADAQVAMLDQMLEDKLISEQQYADAIYQINKKLQEDIQALNDETKASNLEIIQASIQAAGQLASDLQSLADVNTAERLKGVEKGSEAEQRILEEQFERNKKFQIAQAIINTAAGITQAWTQPYPLNFILAGSAAASGALQIAAIKRTTFGGGDTSVPSSPNPSNSINYSFGQQAGQELQLGQSSTAQQTPIQTYVLASDVTNAQQAQQQIQNLSRL